MSIFNFLSKKNTKEISPEELQSLVLYNTEYNLLILVSFGAIHFYSVFEFLDAAHRAGLKTILSHYAKEIKDDSDEFKLQSPNIVDNRYYILIGGRPENYANLYNYLSLSNEVIVQLTEDFYNNCDANKFKSITDYDLVLYKDRFKYKGKIPEYDALVQFENTIIRRTCLADDIITIFTRVKNLSNLFDPIDLGRLILIYHKVSQGTIQDYISIEELAKKALGTKGDSATDSNVYYYKLLELAAKHTVCRWLFSEDFTQPIPLSFFNIYTVPIFMREDITIVDNRVAADVAIENLDEIFRQKYDKFNMPTAEYADSYKGIDEYITSNSDELE